MTIHESLCPLNGTDQEHDDAAKRISDTYNLHRVVDPIGSLGHWIAVRISDGTSDNVLYDSKHDAVTHQHHDELYYWFIPLKPTSMNYCQAASGLSGVRKLYDAGIRLVDRDMRSGGLDLIPRVTAEDMRNQMRSLLSGGKLPQSNIRLPRR